MKHVRLVAERARAAVPPADVVRHLASTRGAADLSLLASFGLKLLDANPDNIQLITATGKVLWMNHAARAIAAAGTTGSGHITWVSEQWPDLTPTRLASVVAGADSVKGSELPAPVASVDGQSWWNITLMPDSDGRAGQLLLIARNATAQRRAAIAAKPAIGQDPLTGLADGDRLRARITALMAAGDQDFSVLAIELDPAPPSDDLSGRNACDEGLRRVAQRLAQATCEGELAARLDVGCFAMLLRGGHRTNGGEAVRRARAIVGRVIAPLDGRKRQKVDSISIGLAHCEAGAPPDSILRHAHYALQMARKTGRGQVAIFDTRMHQELAQRDAMLKLAACALDGGNVIPHYQAKVDLQSGRIIGFEALLRWRTASGAIGSPAAFQAAFDDPDLSVRITDAMLGRVIADLKRWRRRGIDLPVAINMTGYDLRAPGFAERLLDRLAAAGIPPACLEIEITETVVLSRDVDDLAGMLRQLRAAGISIALDDFGTGYASLSHLKQLSVDVIKIDRSFVSNLGECPEDCAIVEAMLNLAKRLGITVVAEGIETASHARFLQARGCNVGQGYLFGKAIPAEAVPQCLTSGIEDFKCVMTDCAGIGCAGNRA